MRYIFQFVQLRFLPDSSCYFDIQKGCMVKTWLLNAAVVMLCRYFIWDPDIVCYCPLALLLCLHKFTCKLFIPVLAVGFTCKEE